MEKLPLLRPLPDERQAPVLAGVTGLFWLAQAVGCYLTVYLQGEGFSAGQLGVLNALCAGVAILSVSFWGTLFDRLGAHPYYRLVGGMYLCSVLVFLLSSLEHRTVPRPLPAGGPRGGRRPPWRGR